MPRPSSTACRRVSTSSTLQPSGDPDAAARRDRAKVQRLRRPEGAEHRLVTDQIRRRLRHAAGLEIGRARRPTAAAPRRPARAVEARVGQRPDAHGDVDRLVDQVDVAVVQQQLDLDVGMGVEEGRHDRRDMAAAELDGCCDPQQAAHRRLAHAERRRLVVAQQRRAPCRRAGGRPRSAPAAASCGRSGARPAGPRARRARGSPPAASGAAVRRPAPGCRPPRCARRSRARPGDPSIIPISGRLISDNVYSGQAGQSAYSTAHTEEPMLTGSCLCGAIAYEADAPLVAHHPLPLPDLPQDAWRGLLVGDGRAARGVPLDARQRAARRLRILARQVPPLLHALRLASDGRAGGAAGRAAAAGLPRHRGDRPAAGPYLAHPTAPPGTTRRRRSPSCRGG